MITRQELTAQAAKAEKRRWLEEAAPDMLAALKECRKVLGIRDEFVPLGAAVTLAPIIDAAIAKAEGKKQ
jgi:hypothetical protein